MKTTLKEWCQFMRQQELTEGEQLMVKDVEDCISQVGTWKAKYEQAQVKVNELKNEVEVLRHYGNKICTAMADEFLKGGVKFGE